MKDLRVFDLLRVVGPPFRPDQFVKPCPGNRNVKEHLAASGGGHTLRFHDLGVILAWRGNGVCDGAHSAFVMNEMTILLEMTEPEGD